MIPARAISIPWFAVWIATAVVDGASAQPDELTADDGISKPVAAEAMQSVSDVAAGDEINVLRESFSELRQQGKFSEALRLAKQIAASVEEQQGITLALVEPLTDVINLELELADLAAAERTLSRLVKLIEEKDSVFSVQLIEPLAALGDIFSATGRKEEAVTMLRRARHITHRRLGILNIEQIELADQLAETYFELGRIGEANRENRFAFRVSEHEYGRDSADLVPAINKLASWYEQVGEFGVARRLYHRSVDLVEEEYGKNDLRLVEQLQLVAHTYRKQNVYKNEGRNALIRAVEIQEQHPGVDVIARARSLANLGDWLMVTAKRGEAMRIYRQAWDLLAGDEGNPGQADTIFGRPKRLRFSPPLPDPGLMAGRSEIYVDVEFLVTPEGAVTDLSIVDASAHWRIQNDVRVAMRHARYRPMFVNGESVPKKVRHRWTYRSPDHQQSNTGIVTATDVDVED